MGVQAGEPSASMQSAARVTAQDMERLLQRVAMLTSLQQLHAESEGPRAACQRCPRRMPAVPLCIVHAQGHSPWYLTQLELRGF